MDFSEIGKKIATMGLPLLANAVVPGGGAIVSLIASALGLTNDEPDTIALALQSDPNAAVKLKELQTRHIEKLEEIALQRYQAELSAETTQQSNINKTIQEELKSDSSYKSGWRPLFGYFAAFGVGGILLGLVYSIFDGPENAGNIVESATVMITMMLAVLGINIRSRSQDKQAFSPNRPLGLVEAFANRIGKK